MVAYNVSIGPGWEIGPGWTIGASVPTFALTSADFTNTGSNGYYSVSLGGSTGVIMQNGQTGPGQAIYNIYLSQSLGGNPAKSAELAAFWTAQGWSLTDGTARIFDATWGAGSTQSTGKVILTLLYFDVNNCNLYLGTVYTGNNNWQTGGQDIYNGSGLLNELGTFALPATFTLYTPVITFPGNWC